MRPELVRLVHKRDAQPRSRHHRISDLAEFIANPIITSNGRYSIKAELTPRAIETLRTERRAMVKAGGVDVELVVTAWTRKDGMEVRSLLGGNLGTAGLTVDPGDLGGWSPPSLDPREESAPPINWVPENIKPSLEYNRQSYQFALQ